MDQASEQPQPPAITFEDALARLEAVVDELEKGDLTLAAALDAFKDGISNLSICVQDLNAFEEQIEVLLSEYYASAPAWLGGLEPGGRAK